MDFCERLPAKIEEASEKEGASPLAKCFFKEFSSFLKDIPHPACEERDTNPRTQTTLVCPLCGREQAVDTEEYLHHISLPGHPYTCGNEACPSHTELVPKNPVMVALKELKGLSSLMGFATLIGGGIRASIGMQQNDEALREAHAGTGILVRCPICERREVVPIEDYFLNLDLGGEAPGCPLEGCPGTMIPVFPEDVCRLPEEEDEGDYYPLDFDGVPHKHTAEYFRADLRPLLEGATIVEYGEEEIYKGADHDIILTLEKAGIRYRIRFSPTEELNVLGSEADIPALRKIDPAFNDALLKGEHWGE